MDSVLKSSKYFCPLLHSLENLGEFECDDFMQIYKSSPDLFIPFLQAIDRLHFFTLGKYGWNDVFYRYHHIKEIKQYMSEFGSYPQISFCSRLKRLFSGQSLQPYHIDSNNDAKFMPTPIIDLCIKNQPRIIPIARSLIYSPANSALIRSNLLDTNKSTASTKRSKIRPSLRSAQSKPNRNYRNLCSLLPKGTPEASNTPNLSLSIFGKGITSDETY